MREVAPWDGWGQKFPRVSAAAAQRVRCLASPRLLVPHPRHRPEILQPGPSLTERGENPGHGYTAPRHEPPGPTGSRPIRTNGFPDTIVGIENQGQVSSAQSPLRPAGPAEVEPEPIPTAKARRAQSLALSSSNIVKTTFGFAKVVCTEVKTTWLVTGPEVGRHDKVSENGALSTGVGTLDREALGMKRQERAGQEITATKGSTLLQSRTLHLRQSHFSVGNHKASTHHSSCHVPHVGQRRVAPLSTLGHFSVIDIIDSSASTWLPLPFSVPVPTPCFPSGPTSCFPSTHKELQELFPLKFVSQLPAACLINVNCRRFDLSCVMGIFARDFRVRREFRNRNSARAKVMDPMRGVEVIMAQRQNEKVGKTGDRPASSSGTIPTCENPGPVEPRKPLSANQPGFLSAATLDTPLDLERTMASRKGSNLSDTIWHLRSVQFILPTQQSSKKDNGLIERYSVEVGQQNVLGNIATCMVSNNAMFNFVYKDLDDRAMLKICDEKGISHPFSNNKVGKDWFHGFMRRNNDTVLKKVGNSSYCRLMRFNKEIVSAHFELLRKTPDKMNLNNQPHLIYNVDESGLLLTYTCSQLVLAERGCKRVHVAAHGEKGETVTLVACTNVTGTNWILPMIVYKGKYLKKKRIRR
ncbi:hypothetical protein PR048_012192 [Dryococelus australis]|uniref:Transposase n=1 Tax=Dryococelus australis TaxID=614101 RepID=A0ABQ9HNV2_9NEOP|nr:hypothetical protein PR048_012192 [Dryococelus australis]